MSIWFKNYTLEAINQQNKKTMLEHLAIEITEITEKSLVGTMPVDHRTVQPHGLLHGGASVVLAESLASIAGNLVLDPEKFYGVGLEINANHVRPVKSGLVTGRASAIHLGKSTQIWQIEIFDESEHLVCHSRMTLAVLKKS